MANDIASSSSQRSFEHRKTSSGTSSLPGPGELRTPTLSDINEIKCDVMVNWLYQQQTERLWTAGGRDEGVVLKIARNSHACCPSDLSDEQYGFFNAVQALNVKVNTAHSFRRFFNV
jgi:hypothetical protein